MSFHAWVPPQTCVTSGSQMFVAHGVPWPILFGTL